MKNGNTHIFFSSTKTGVYVEPGAMEQLPKDMQEAIINAASQKRPDPNIVFLKKQLDDPNFPEAFKKRLAETIAKSEKNNSLEEASIEINSLKP